MANNLNNPPIIRISELEPITSSRILRNDNFIIDHIENNTHNTYRTSLNNIFKSLKNYYVVSQSDSNILKINNLKRNDLKPNSEIYLYFRNKQVGNFKLMMDSTGPYPVKYHGRQLTNDDIINANTTLIVVFVDTNEFEILGGISENDILREDELTSNYRGNDDSLPFSQAGAYQLYRLYNYCIKTIVNELKQSMPQDKTLVEKIDVIFAYFDRITELIDSNPEHDNYLATVKAIREYIDNLFINENPEKPGKIITQIIELVNKLTIEKCDEILGKITSFVHNNDNLFMTEEAFEDPSFIPESGKVYFLYEE